MIGRGHIDIDIKQEDILQIIDKMNELMLEDIMVCDFGIDFEMFGNRLDYTQIDSLIKWLESKEYSFSITIDEWIHNEYGGFHYDSDHDEE